MNYVIEYVEENGKISKLQIIQKRHRDVMAVMNRNFDSIKDFIGEGHVEPIRASEDIAYFVHDNGNLLGMDPNPRFDLEYLKGKVVIIKTLLPDVIPEIITAG